MFDYLIVGAGFAGSVLAERLASQLGAKVLLCDKRPHIAGNAYDHYDDDGLLVHKYGPHIFHTASARIFEYLSKFTQWRPYEHRVLASVEGALLPFPINVDTVNRLYGLSMTGQETAAYFKAVAEPIKHARTSEEAVVGKIGRDLYLKFFRNYTRKQWGLDPSELDAAVAARVPARADHDDRYFTDPYQAMPQRGYTRLFENLLDHPNITLVLNADYRDVAAEVKYREMIYSGPVDAFFDYRYGKLPYRSIDFKFETHAVERFQPAAVINYPNEREYTRITEFKYLTGQQHAKTSIVYEYPTSDGDPYYPVPRKENTALYEKYKALADVTPNVRFVGRLGTYRYYNMDQVVGQSLALFDQIREPRATADESGKHAQREVMSQESPLSGLGRIGSLPPPFEEASFEHGYPRPQLRRDDWISLNGTWDFAIDVMGLIARPEDVNFDSKILVPFSPEAPRSGVFDTGLYCGCWYRRQLPVPELSPTERLILHFGAVDYEATVFIDGVPVCSHEGGYTPFSVDITDAAKDRNEVTLAVRAYDDPADLAKPRGKQDWQRVPHSIWYPRTTGIWQTVWMERVPAMHIQHVRWTPSLQRWEIGLEARVAHINGRAHKLGVRLRAGNVTLADDTYSVVAAEVHRRIALSDPGIDDFRNLLLWSPEMPTLIAVELRLIDEQGLVIDRAQSYTALRAVAVQGDRFVLNGRPYPLRMVLDQGYWPETGLTAPDDAALRKDVELAKQMGFNGVRKHQKLEDPRYLYWADRLGLLVWEEMPSAYRFTRRSIERTTAQWSEAIERDGSHPCIVCWVPFNESWGVPNLPEIAVERHYVQAVYHLTKSLDPSRPVVGNDGWESVATDMVGIHDYDARPARLHDRYYTQAVVPQFLQRERPGGRLLLLDGQAAASLPLVLSEFGGIALARPDETTWGYSRCRTPEELAARYSALLSVVTELQVFAGFCYTQFADTYQEANGLLYADRTPKFPLAAMTKATHGAAQDLPLDVLASSPQSAPAAEPDSSADTP